MNILRIAVLVMVTVVVSEACSDLDENACGRLKTKDPNICQDDTIATTTCPKMCGTCKVCADVDETACKLLRGRDANICQDDTIAKKTCPKMCGSCHLACLSCNDVEDPRNCTTTTECGAHQDCIISEHLANDFHVSYKMGCVDKTMCANLHQHPLFGRRDTDSNVRLHYHCCSTDRCNSQLLTATTTFPGNYCYDQIQNCTTTYGDTVCSWYKDWSKINCARSCGFCGKYCHDKLSNCKDYGHSACSGQYQAWAKTNCANYCWLCGSVGFTTSYTTYPPIYASTYPSIVPPPGGKL